MSMKLTEDIQRVKNLMGLNLLTEGLFRKTGKLKELLGKEIDLSKVENPVDKKYGKLDTFDTKVDSFSAQKTNQVDKNFLQYNLSISFYDSIRKTPLPSDPTKSATQTACSLTLQTQNGTKIDYYGYNKLYFYIDGAKTDTMSQVNQNKTFTCYSNTLENKPGECKIDDKMLETIRTVFKDDKDYQTIDSYLKKLY